MATNNYQAKANEIVPLRGDMAVTLDAIPAGRAFCEVTIDEPGSYIVSATATIRGLDGVKRSTFAVDGGIGIFVRFTYDQTAQCWKPYKTNLVGAGGSGGTGGPGGTGATPVITAVATTLAPGSSATAVMSGPAATPTLTLGIPRGMPGTNADGSTGSGGTGGPEVEVFADVNGNVTFDAAVSNNFRYLAIGPTKFLNPVGFEDTGGLLRVKVVMGPAAPYAFGWDTAWGFDDGQPPIMPTTAGAITKIDADLTNGDLWLTEIKPKGSSAGFSAITPIARIGATQYYRMYGTAIIPSSSQAMGAAVNGDVIVVQRNGKGGEVTGTAQDKSITITGALPNGNRASLYLGVTEYGQGQANRPSFSKALLNFEGTGASEVRDIKISGVRNEDGDSRGIAPNGAHSLTIRNVEVTNCNNGMMWGAAFTGYVRIFDSLFDGNGVGSPDINNSHGTGSSAGFVHNIYAGENGSEFLIERASFLNSATGHDFKSRAPYTIMRQVLARGAVGGRELDLPYGGKLLAENCIFHKSVGATQGNLITIGGEGTITTRPREYIFRNCRFIMDYGQGGQDATFMVNKDPTVPVRYIDCEWIGEYTKNVNTTSGDSFFAGMTTVNGDRYFPGVAPIKEFTNGPIGPLPSKPVGYFPVANTAVA